MCFKSHKIASFKVVDQKYGRIKYTCSVFQVGQSTVAEFHDKATSTRMMTVEDTNLLLIPQKTHINESASNEILIIVYKRYEYDTIPNMC